MIKDEWRKWWVCLKEFRWKKRIVVLFRKFFFCHRAKIWKLNCRLTYEKLFPAAFRIQNNCRNYTMFLLINNSRSKLFTLISESNYFFFHFHFVWSIWLIDVVCLDWKDLGLFLNRLEYFITWLLWSFFTGKIVKCLKKS